MNGLIKAKELHFDDEYLHVKLEDERIISTPMKWYKPLQEATISQLKNYKFICMGTGIEWEELDYHLSIEGMLESSKEKVA
ncbi:DUF2442 domain-containing protein [Hydrogenimonas thermophila]|uniref:DUF2442 domain-containing protein n=1 Tax=Hydrogenimonas thermophila TaxID=223786 RepID=A0A1I5RYI2_9BACT|nr:DUF2442 domain-containing protein [Hydrogenimonas thermophila]WOE69249.1 DUF2442 domain-containing protein [Hydrogenimonas thermophila]WOE71759.1 DUF2442 domain-containing protein [Hydrogenimonas thermophila]SFP63562.1 Protein of unknown function [Hydrogenimonas thermophila]